MIYLIQILRMMNKRQRQEFLALFSDLEYELDELGFRGNETDLISGMLFNHYGLSIENEKQLRMLTDAILKPNNLKAAVTAANIL